MNSAKTRKIRVFPEIDFGYFFKVSVISAWTFIKTGATL